MVVSFTPEQAENHIEQLVVLLIDAVDSGASVGFMPPLAESEARIYWESVIAAMRQGTRVLLVALDGDLIQGSVHRRARRRGLARALMVELESTARKLGRTLLVMDTRQGGEAEKMCESLGYVRYGAVPGYTARRSPNSRRSSPACIPWCRLWRELQCK
jgi:GNAT superfamily N-acetyltransferase